VTGSSENAEPEGPWRIGSRLRVVVTGEAGDLRAAGVASRIGAALAASGIVIQEHRAVLPEEVASLLWRLGAVDADILLLDTGTDVSPSAVAELCRVVDSDPMLVAAMPRFAAASADTDGAQRPDVTYTALPDRRCLYVKGSVLAAFAGSRRSGIPQHGESADADDALLWLNRFGFRIAAANRALAFHPEGAVQNRADAVPPEWRPALARHLSSAPRLAETLLSGLRPGPDGRRGIAFDLAHLGPCHSGTTRLARAVIERAVARWHDLSLHIVADTRAYAFHFGDLDGRVERVDPEDRRCFAALIRFGQPFLWKEIDAVLRRAPVLVLLMLDTIGLDCLQHAPDELDALWRFVFAEADGVLFNSAFTKRQFARRFVFRPGMPCRASLHSLDLAEYREARGSSAIASTGAILMVGNDFPHKHLRETAAVLATAGLPHPVVVLGLEPGTVAGVACRPSGSIAPHRMAELYGSARIVVYPSVYEGFGFPILEALAYRRPVLVRALPPYAEIAASLPEAPNIHVFADDTDLLRTLKDPPAWIEIPSPAASVRTWNDAADDLRALLDECLAAASFDRVVRRIDVLRGRMAFMRGRAFAPAPDPGDPDGVLAQDDLDRMAGMAGRLAYTSVLAFGRTMPGGYAVLRLAGRLLRWSQHRSSPERADQAVR
jgi:glycosyltransferase involved in cell wall biosynthesis